VGLLAGDFSEQNLSRLIVGAEREARRQGYGVLMTSIDLEVSGTEYALPSLMERRVDGILLAAPQMEEDRAVARALDKTVPVVSLHHIPGGGVATVGSDDELTGLLATRHLVAKGHRVIATVIGPRARSVTESRVRVARERHHPGPRRSAQAPPPVPPVSGRVDLNSRGREARRRSDYPRLHAPAGFHVLRTPPQHSKSERRLGVDGLVRLKLRDRL